MNRSRFVCIFCLLFNAHMSIAEDRIWTGAVDNQFGVAGNWEGGIPMVDDDLAVIDGGDNLPVIIPESAGELMIGGFQLGSSGDAGGHVVQNGGTLLVAPFGLDGFPTDFEFKSHIGDKGTSNSSWIMNNNAIMLYDSPFESEGFGFDTDGENAFDLEVGAATGEGVGSLELHDNAVLRISDDLKIGAEDNGNGLVIMDGNSVATIGSGISVGEKDSGKGALQLSGNALLVSGNSADPGMSEVGRTNEGYLTLTTADMTISDAAKVYVRTLQHRSGITNLTLQDASQLHVFDVFENAEPNLGEATVVGSASGPQRTSHMGGNAESEFNLIIQDDSVMSVDSELDDSAWSGLAVSGGSNKGANADGGKSLIEVRDRGSFTVQQDLHLTLGIGETAESTLRVVGPDAKVAVNGNLYLALDPEGIENLGNATLQTVITGNSHATVSVAGDAEIGNGKLSVELDGYSPRGGESYTLLEAANIEATEFLETDFSLATLPEGLDWNLAIEDNAVVLSIAGMLDSLLGDFDSANDLDVNDIDALVAHIQAAGMDVSFDVNSDGLVNASDIDAWLTLKSDSDGVAILPGDTDLDGTVAFADFLQLSNSFGNADTTWSQGNFDGQDGTAFADFLALSDNFGATAGTQAVPEPNAMCFVFAVPFLLILRKRKRFPVGR